MLEDSLTGGPAHTASTKDMDVDVVDGLASIWSIVDDESVSFSQACILSALFCNEHHVAQQLRGRENDLMTR